MKKLLLSAYVGMLACSLVCAEQSVSHNQQGRQYSEKEFEASVLDKFKEAVNKPLVIVYFSKMDDQIPADTLVRQDVRDMEARFQDVSNNYRYRDADVMFVNANVLQPKALQQIANQYGVQKYPTFMLFRNGQPVTENGKPVQRVAFLSEADLKTFIDTYFGDDIDQLVKKMERARAEGRREAYYDRPRTYVSFGYGYPYYWGGSYWGYPYYRGYWGYPYRRYYGGVGFGVGFGGGYRRGYYGRGWRGRRW